MSFFLMSASVSRLPSASRIRSFLRSRPRPGGAITSITRATPTGPQIEYLHRSWSRYTPPLRFQGPGSPLPRHGPVKHHGAHRTNVARSRPADAGHVVRRRGPTRIAPLRTVVEPVVVRA